MDATFLENIRQLEQLVGNVDTIQDFEDFYEAMFLDVQERMQTLWQIINKQRSFIQRLRIQAGQIDNQEIEQ